MEPSDFPNLQAASRRLGPLSQLSRQQLRELICHDCSFWHDDHEEELECSGFRMLALMLANGSLTPQSLEQAVNGRREDR